MTITTNRGQEFDVNWAWAVGGVLRIELPGIRKIGDIAEDFDGLVKIERESEEEGDDTYIGYDTLTGVTQNRQKGTTLLTLEKGGADNG